LLAVTLSVGAAIGLTFLWPYYNLAQLVAGFGDYHEVHRDLYKDVLPIFGLAFLGVPALIHRYRCDHTDPLALLFVLASAVVLVGALTDRYALGRAWPAVLIALHFALATQIATGHTASRWKEVVALACLIGCTVQGRGLLFANPALPISFQKKLHVTPLWRDYTWVARRVPVGTVVATDSLMARRTLPAFGEYVVSPPWPDPLLIDANNRTSDEISIFDSRTSAAMKKSILDRYRVGWVLRASQGNVVGLPLRLVARGPDQATLYQVIHTGGSK
jgi:alpha-1,6-mannosyltransferase